MKWFHTSQRLMGGLLPIKSGGDIVFIYIKAYAIFFIQVHDC